MAIRFPRPSDRGPGTNYNNYQIRWNRDQSSKQSKLYTIKSSELVSWLMLIRDKQISLTSWEQQLLERILTMSRPLYHHERKLALELIIKYRSLLK